MVVNPTKFLCKLCGKIGRNYRGDVGKVSVQKRERRDVANRSAEPGNSAYPEMASLVRTFDRVLKGVKAFPKITMFA